MQNILEKDHAEIEEIQNRLFRTLEKGSAEMIFELTDLFWARLAIHIRAEHLQLFPAILGALKTQNQVPFGDIVLTFDSVENIVNQLKADHSFFMRVFGQTIKTLRELIKTPNTENSKAMSSVKYGISEVCRRLDDHNKLEETGIYPLAQNILSFGDYKLLIERILKELGNAPPRIRKFSNG